MLLALAADPVLFSLPLGRQCVDVESTEVAVVGTEAFAGGWSVPARRGSIPARSRPRGTPCPTNAQESPQRALVWRQDGQG